MDYERWQKVSLKSKSPLYIRILSVYVLKCPELRLENGSVIYFFVSNF